MKKRPLRIFGWTAFGLSVLLGLMSCVKDVSMDAEDRPRMVVVWCILTDDPVQELKLFFTIGPDSKQSAPVTDAEVTLTDLTAGTDAGSFRRKEDDDWILANAAIPGHRYRLDVRVPGYAPISAEQTMPVDPGVVSSAVFKMRIPGLNYPSLFSEDVFVPNAEEFGQLPLGQRCYGFRELEDPLWICAVDYDPHANRHRVADEICTTFSLTSDFNLLGRGYDPPMRDDIPNEYVEGSHIAKLYPQLEGAELHRKYLRFPEIPYEEKRSYTFVISGSMQGKYNCTDFYRWYYGDRGLVTGLQPDEGYLLFTSVSEDYDKYLLDAYAKQEIQESTDLSTIYLRDNVFTNLSGALGLFGAAIIRKLQWSGEYDYIDDGLPYKIFKEDEWWWWAMW